MPENTLDDQDINVFIVKVRSHAVPQGMAGNVKGRMEVGLKQYFFQIIFHGSDRYPVTLFRDKKRRCEPTVTKQLAHSQVLAQDFN